MSDVCPNCDAPDNFHTLDPVRGDVICMQCGCCLPDRVLDETLEKRNFAESGKDHNRGAELDKYLSFASQGTTIGKGTGNLQKAQNRLKPAAMSARDRNLTDGFHNIRHYETMFGLTRAVVNTAKDLMVAFEEKRAKTVQGARSEAFAVAICFFAMNLHSVGKSLKEIQQISNVPEKRIRSYVKKIQKTIPWMLTKHTTATDFIPTIVSTLEAPHSLEAFAGDIVRRALEHTCTSQCGDHIVGARTSTIAAGAILLASEKMALTSVNPEDIAACAQISPATMHNMAKVMSTHWSAMFASEATRDHTEVLHNIMQLAAKAGQPTK